MKYGFTLAALVAASAAHADPLTIYAPDYFASEWGPGPAIKAAFEAECDCEIEYVTGDVLPRILLEGERTKADVVIGFNSDVTKKARETGLFVPHGLDLSPLTLPLEWTDDTFLPFNWSYTAFVYDNTKIKNPPTSFHDLVNSTEDWSIAIQDPRTSISGLALVLWGKEVFGDDAEAEWAKLAPKVTTVTKGWSEAYGLFTDGEVDMVLSYTTSPAYHIIAEEDETKSAALFDEGHYFMVELAAKLKGTDQPELADAFMAFILSPTFQNIIPTANWSYPAALPRDQWPKAFSELNYPEKAIFLDENEADALRDKAIAEWRTAFSQ
ncbi:MAG: thiamine ABC transporter substrate binding subunit [Alphaproteobacteria bacterium]|nr:thiamine ABC transporter substrate binding subunit [Alphaproteobacteria bacterium]MBU1280980.1 thiamine ABC transporter substrate binding subunit [Alphaproteobacteria bacterium]MBU1575520.1 thiamine ABC transporter substrate binding subunit [Alphaproteobacteria bacterium]MBU1829465.1 thiamine ABC transporter substrate binding subunit [Alphaproteobacteria bacterium]MBU2077039.1 thiamine ABC transporter substrate binding subunit [Alphaproteobacteria bacterium]